MDYLLIRGEKTDYYEEVIRIVEDMTKTFVNDILGTLRERGLDLKASCVVFIGGRLPASSGISGAFRKDWPLHLWRRHLRQRKRVWYALPDPAERQINAMGKKNPFVMTIGFNRHDTAHVEVAQFLNGMERGKAQYIVDAVMAYQNGGQAEGSGLTGRAFDHAAIRQIVLQVIEERENGTNGSNTAAEATETAERVESSGENGLAGLDDSALGDILRSLDAFKG